MAEEQNTAQAIGALTAQIEAMNNRLERDREDRKETNAAAAANRERVNSTLLELQQGHKKIVSRLDRVEPVADMVTGWRARFAGAMIVLGFIGTLVILGFGFFKDSILRLIFGT
jgi:predicted phage tail protein|tara:strand:- start:6022 stop:6363 length:342 start_codon:yes stop_codon:yes gene_type:complete